MPDEAVRKELALEYVRLVNAGDLPGLAGLFAEDARLEDPVGSRPLVGRAAIRGRLAQALRGWVREEAGRPVASHDGRHVVIPAVVTVGGPGVAPERRVRTNVMGLIEVGEDGLIRSLRVFWGRSDVSVLAGSEPGEQRRRGLAVEHCERINAGDVAGLLRLYSPGVRFEDPVGAWVRDGLEALRAHATMAVGGKVHEAVGMAVAAQDGRSAAVEVSATMDYLPSGQLLARHKLMDLDPPADPAGTRLGIRYVMFVRVGDDGLVDDMRAYWGASDVFYAPAGAPG